jgi:anti-sigma regulatory factor (Ser/Thr protein kinase)
LRLRFRARPALHSQAPEEIRQLATSPAPPPRVMRLPCDRNGVRRGLACAFAFSMDAAISEEATDKLAIIVEEWLVNVVEHGGGDATSRIAMRIERAGDLVRLSFSDAGHAFDPRDSVFEGPNLERGGGAGLALIQAWSRIADYRRRAGRNRLVLEMPLA